jgi:hypothetical protein
MPAAFVLQWTLEVAAEVGLYAASRHAWIVEPLHSRLSFALHPTQHYPVAAQFRDVTVSPALLEDRVAAAHAAYRTAATELALGYRSGANLGRHQRVAMVGDVWAMVAARARGQRPPRRASCCFIYVLPGVHECSVCPRLPHDGRRQVT